MAVDGLFAGRDLIRDNGEILDPGTVAAQLDNVLKSLK